jgi:prepilin-type N-terminal cleavage/methylation domain-containing protein
MKRAFTLIELLVVIAIIAILAAILFPVFAQAKAAAKKTADLSNIKQITTASHIYLSDYDDVLPLQAGRTQAGFWNYNSRALVPADWSTLIDERTLTAPALPMNSTMPYMKNVDMLLMPGATNDYQPLAAGYLEAPGKKKAVTTYTFNGLLTSLSSTAVANVADVPLWWPGFGQAANKGWNYSQPWLRCDSVNAACVFSPVAACANNIDGSTGGLGTNTQGTSWCFSQGQNWSFVDGHAKFRKMGTSQFTNNPKRDPWYERNTAGVGISYWTDGCYPAAFRPDLQL